MTDVVIPGATTTVAGDRPISVGDQYTAPIQIFGASGSVVVHPWGAGPEPDEPDVQPAATNPDESIWLDYLPTASGTLTISATTDVLVDLGSGDDVASFVAAVSGNPHTTPLAIITGSNSPMKVRVRPAVPASPLQDATISWSFVVTPVPLVLSVLSDLQQAPGTFRVSVTNGVPGTAVTFTDSAADVIPASVLDEDGSLLSYSVQITSALAAGTYTLTASSAGRSDGTATFKVIKAPLTDPVGQPADATPVAVAPVAGVRKWVLQDPAPAGEQYVFEINPDSATSPHGENTFTVDVTTAPDGQVLTWEGARKSVDWSFKGTLLTSTQYQAFERFAALQRRVFLIDNRNRAWVVSIEYFDPTPKRVIDNDWAHTYTINCVIYKGPLVPA